MKKVEVVVPFDGASTAEHMAKAANVFSHVTSQLIDDLSRREVTEGVLCDNLLEMSKNNKQSHATIFDPTVNTGANMPIEVRLTSAPTILHQVEQRWYSIYFFVPEELEKTHVIDRIAVVVDQANSYSVMFVDNEIVASTKNMHNLIKELAFNVYSDDQFGMEGLQGEYFLAAQFFDDENMAVKIGIMTGHDAMSFKCWKPTPEAHNGRLSALILQDIEPEEAARLVTFSEYDIQRMCAAAYFQKFILPWGNWVLSGDVPNNVWPFPSHIQPSPPRRDILFTWFSEEGIKSDERGDQGLLGAFRSNGDEFDQAIAVCNVNLGAPTLGPKWEFAGHHQDMFLAGGELDYGAGVEIQDTIAAAYRRMAYQGFELVPHPMVKDVSERLSRSQYIYPPDGWVEPSARFSEFIAEGVIPPPYANDI